MSAPSATLSAAFSADPSSHDQLPMPLYDYKCENDHVFEVMQSFSSEPVATCGDCGTLAKRQLSIPMVLYKGSGFYTTDYGRNGSASKQKSSSNGEASESESKPKKKAKSKSSSSDSSD